MIDIDKLEALAKSATQGPWRGDRIDGTVKYDIVAGDYPNGKYTVVCHGDNCNASDGGYGFTSAENEDYVLAANPAAILALIAEVRALREDAERYRWLRDKANSMGHVKRAPMVLMTNADCSNDGWRDVLLGAGLDAAIDDARGAA